uniref:Uncharacterized protein n=1 Tax=Anguilla anguilla TaxID=7936 RepID=A0A0E9QYR5_ANGAN
MSRRKLTRQNKKPIVHVPVPSLSQVITSQRRAYLEQPRTAAPDTRSPRLPSPSLTLCLY